MNNFEFGQNLERRLLEFAKKITAFCRNLPKDKLNQDYASQLNRSGCSIGANYIEANEAISPKDFYHRIKISRKESKESIYWLEIIEYNLPALKDMILPLKNEANEYLRLFSSIINKAKNIN